MTSTKKRLLLLELVAGQMPLDEARRRLAEILQRPRRRPSRVLNWPLKSVHHTAFGMLITVVGFPGWPTRRRIRGLLIKRVIDHLPDGSQRRKRRYLLVVYPNRASQEPLFDRGFSI